MLSYPFYLSDTPWILLCSVVISSTSFLLSCFQISTAPCKVVELLLSLLLAPPASLLVDHRMDKPFLASLGVNLLVDQPLFSESAGGGTPAEPADPAAICSLSLQLKPLHRQLYQRGYSHWRVEQLAGWILQYPSKHMQPPNVAAPSSHSKGIQ